MLCDLNLCCPSTAVTGDFIGIANATVRLVIKSEFEKLGLENVLIDSVTNGTWQTVPFKRIGMSEMYKC